MLRVAEQGSVKLRASFRSNFKKNIFFLLIMLRVVKSKIKSQVSPFLNKRTLPPLLVVSIQRRSKRLSPILKKYIYSNFMLRVVKSKKRELQVEILWVQF
jgi:hypothetical protein